MTGHTDDQDGQVPESIRRAAAAYHEPPPTPRDEIWARIEARRRAGGAAGDVIPIGSLRARRVTARRWAMGGAGLAAVLVLGFGIGRMSGPDANELPAPAVVAGEEVRRPTTAAFDVAAAQHFSRVESFLVSLRTSPDESSFASQARDLLLSTRLLLDAPGTGNPQVRALLEDLELILVQVAQLDRRGTDDYDLITDGLERRQVVPRLQSAIPAGLSRL